MARARKPRFTNEKLILGALRTNARPLTAYQLISRLRTKGVRSPAIVDRALKRLINDGRAHRVESLNAYVASVDPETQSASLFAVCRHCGTTQQVYNPLFADGFRSWAESHNFHVEQMSFELMGRCNGCLDTAQNRLASP